MENLWTYIPMKWKLLWHTFGWPWPYFKDAIWPRKVKLHRISNIRLSLLCPMNWLIEGWPNTLSFHLKEVQRLWICKTLTLYAYMWCLRFLCMSLKIYFAYFRQIRLSNTGIIVFKRPYHLNKYTINFQTSMKIRTDYIFTSYSLLLAKRIPKFYKGETDSLGVACQLCPPTEGEGTYSVCVCVGVGVACCQHLSSEPICEFWLNSHEYITAMRGGDKQVIRLTQFARYGSNDNVKFSSSSASYLVNKSLDSDQTQSVV